MGIEPTRVAPLRLENKQCGAMADPKCDGRVNIRGMWGHVGLRGDTSVGEIRGLSQSGAGLLPANNRQSSGSVSQPERTFRSANGYATAIGSISGRARQSRFTEDRWRLHGGAIREPPAPHMA